MTDKEKLEKLFTEFGIGFSPEDIDTIRCDEGDTNVNGYPYFYTLFKFDENGKFIEMGIWE